MFKYSLEENPGLKRPSHSLPTAAAALLAAALAATTIAQAPAPPQTPAQQPQAGAPGGQPGRFPREWPKPTNLQVLPKTLTGNQVREIMEKWQGDLGVHCNACHAEDPKNIGPNGRPRLNFADDSKQEKKTARLMFKMTEKINDDYISMVDMDHDMDHDGGANDDHASHKVTCGTCHRGHQHPEAFIPPPEHEGPRPPQGAAGMPTPPPPPPQ